LSEDHEKCEKDLRKRLLNFSVNIMKYLMRLPDYKELDVFRYQLSKSATSIGAKYEEARGSAEDDFVQKLRIALCEANESKYWLQVLDELNLGELGERKTLMQESDQISVVFGNMITESAQKLQAQQDT
jgi:four helix bundle protein